MNNTFFGSMTNGVKITLFISMILIGAALGSVLGIVIAGLVFHIPLEELTNVIAKPNGTNAHVLIWINNVAQLCTFLLPVSFFAALFGNKEITGLKKFPLILVLASPVIVFAASGIIDWASSINHLVIPEGSWLESIFKPSELAAENMVKVLLGQGSDNYMILAFVSVTILPAICEELVFRGVLQPLFSKSLSNVHLGIWISAAIFSAIHFQFYGFLPRLILGAILGYLVLWSGSLWTAIIAHFANNAIAFWLYRHYGATETPDDSVQGEWYFTLAITLFFGALIYWYYRTGKTFGYKSDYTS